MKKISKVLSLFLCAALLLTSCEENGGNIAAGEDVTETAASAIITTESSETTTAATSEALSVTELTTVSETVSEETTAETIVISDTATTTVPEIKEEALSLTLKEENADSYYDKIYTLTNISDEIVTNPKEKLSSFAEFSGITVMQIWFENGDLEIVQWNNGVPDFENSKKYFDALSTSDFTSGESLKPGESWEIEVSSRVQETTTATTTVYETTKPNTVTTVITSTEATTTTAKTTKPVTTAEEKYKPSDAEYKAVMPSDSVISEAVKMAVTGEEVCIALYEDGRYEVMSRDEMLDTTMLKTVEEMLSREYYEEITKLYEEYPDMMNEAGFGSYEEYRETVFSMFGDYEKYFDEDGKLLKEVKPYFYFRYEYKGYDGEGFVSAEEAAEAGLRWLFGLRAEKSGLEPLIEYVFEQGVTDGIYACCEYGGKGTANVRTYYYSHSIDFDAEETLTFETEGGIFLCDVFVPSDTKKLFITSRDKWSAEILVDFLPEDCLWVCDEGDEYSEDFVFDLEEISKALPNLTELYMYQTLVANPDSIGDMKNLTALSYYAIDEVVNGFPARTDSPFTSLKKLKKLRLYGEYTDYSFLNKMTSLEDVYVCMESAASAESLFKNKCVTGLKIRCSGFDSSGMKNMTNLKYLETNAYLDMNHVAQVPSLTELRIEGSSSAKVDLSPLVSLKNLEKFEINAVRSTDWSFLRELKKLKKLLLYYTNTTDDDIKGLNVTELDLSNTNNHYSVLSEMPKLRWATVSELYGSIDDFKGSSTLESYGELFGDSGNYSTLALCPNLQSINLMGCNGTFDAKDFTGLKKLKEVYLNGTKILNGEKLGEIKSLKIIGIYSYSVDASLADTLKKKLPDCDISVEADQFFNNNT